MNTAKTHIERIGVFGGSFNPPTQTHLMLAEHLIGRYVDRILFLPVGDTYVKPELIEAHHRLKMLELVTQDNPAFALSDLEIRSAKANYTYDSLMTLQESYPDASLFFLMGSDQLPALSTWYRGETLLQTFHFILLVRAEDEPEELFRADPWLLRFRDRFHISIDHPRSNLSSHMIRRRVAAGESIRYLVEPCIIDYIAAHGLYSSYSLETVPSGLGE